MCRVRLVVLGGGGFRVPLLHRALLVDAAGGGGVVDDVVLVDPDPLRLDAVLAVLDHLGAAGSGPRLTIRATTDLEGLGSRRRLPRSGSAAWPAGWWTSRSPGAKE